MFRHPLAGVQFVKGRPEPGETPFQTAAREFREEAGFDLEPVADLGPVQTTAGTWHMIEMPASTLPNTWVHHCRDDGGHDFSFFWQPLGAPLPSGTHPAFHAVMRRLQVPSKSGH